MALAVRENSEYKILTVFQLPWPHVRATHMHLLHNKTLRWLQWLQNFLWTIKKWKKKQNQGPLNWHYWSNKVTVSASFLFTDQEGQLCPGLPLILLYSPLPQPGPAGSFHSQGVHGGENPLVESFLAVGTPQGDACGSATYTPPATMSNNSNWKLQGWTMTLKAMHNHHRPSLFRREENSDLK